MFIADHGIEGVDRFIGHGQRRAAEEQEKERRDNAIHRVLRHGLHHRTVDLRWLELRGIAPDNPESLCRLSARSPACSGRATAIADCARQRPASAVKIIHTSTSHPSRVDPVRQRQYAPGHAPCQADNHQPHHPAADAQRPVAMADASHYTLADGDQATYPAHRMRPVRRIANDDIKYPGYTRREGS